MSFDIPKTRKIWKLKAYAGEKLNIDDVFELAEEPIPELKDGDILLRVDHIALEPTMRNAISQRKSYSPPVPLGSPMWCFCIATVVASKDASYAVGSLIFTNGCNMATYAVLNPKALQGPAGRAVAFQQITKGAEEKTSFDPREYLASFGPPGLAAYVGLFSPKVGDFKKGDVVLVDGAAGATGRLVIQMAKARGAGKIIAIASSRKEKAVLDSGADVFVAYDQDNFAEKLKEVAKEDVNLLFENVGGPIFEAALTCMAPHSRVALCGIVSEYDSQPYGNKSMRSILINRINVKGYICSDPEVACNQVEGIQQLLKENKIHSLIHEFKPHGIESVPKALVGLFEGQNTGKMTVSLN